MHLALDVVQRLKQRLGDTGTTEEGLLFGRTGDGVSEVLDFQPAASGSVPNMVAALSTGATRSLIGYYRTEAGDTFHLNALDRSLSEQCFAKPSDVFLMIHSNGFGAPNATFFWL